MSSEWKSNAAVLEDWEDEAEDWLPPAKERSQAEGVLIDTLAEAMQERFPDRELPDFNLSRREPNETQAEFQLRELKQFFNEAIAAIADSDLDRRFLQQEMAGNLAGQVMEPMGEHDPEQMHSLGSDFNQAQQLLHYFLENPGLHDTLVTPKVLRDFNEFAQNNPESPVHELRDPSEATLNYRYEGPIPDNRSPAEAYAIERLAAIFLKQWPESHSPELDPARRQPGETLVDFQLREIKEALTAAVQDESKKYGDTPQDFANRRDFAAKELAQAALEPGLVDRWADPHGYFKEPVKELAHYLTSDPDSYPTYFVLNAINEAGSRFPTAWSLNPGNGEKSLEHLLEPTAVEFRDPAPDVTLKLTEFTEKLLAFHNDPEAIFERRRIIGYAGSDTFYQDQPETLIFKSLDIANNEMAFSTLEQRREFAELAAEGLLDQLLGGNTEARKILAGSHMEPMPGYIDSFVTEDQEAYARAEASFKELLVNQLATYRPTWTLHIDEAETPLIIADCIKNLKGLIDGETEASPTEIAKRMDFQREHFSPYTEAQSYSYHATAQHEWIPDFTMARYLEPPPRFNMEGAKAEEWLQRRGIHTWQDETHALLAETLQSLTERYPGTALHKGQLDNHYAANCLQDLNLVFKNQSFASAEHRQEEAQAIAEAIVPADDPLLREWNHEGWLASAQANLRLQEFLNDDQPTHQEYHYFRIIEKTAIARQARKEAREFLRELAAIPA